MLLFLLLQLTDRQLYSQSVDYAILILSLFDIIIDCING